MEKVKVIDSIMGSGKTEWAIAYMNANRQKRFIYITPFNDEIENRILPRCAGFVTGNPGSKFQDFKRLLMMGKNIAATHECFKMADEETRNLIEAQGYTLILDEVMEVIQDIKLSSADIATVLGRHAYIEKGTGSLIWTDTNYEADGRFYDIRKMSESRGLIAVTDPNGKCNFLLWLFPSEIFKSFDEVYLLTYLFDSQLHKAYFDLNCIPFEKWRVVKIGSGYEIIPHDGVTDDKIQIKIDIYEGALNSIGKNLASLSASWFKSRKNKSLQESLANNMYNFFRNICNAKSKEVLWTCFKTAEKGMKKGGFSKGFAVCNIRATNKFRDRTAVAYCVNIYMRPVIKNYFASRGVSIDEDGYALSEMLQFLWRSALRQGKEIRLYIPSSRMRGLLQKWIQG